MSEKTLGELAGLGENAIKHYGVKGMKWGVRKDRSLRTKQTQTIKDARASNRASRRAIKTASSEAQKLKLKEEYKKDPSRYLGRRLTTGERAAATVLKTAGVLSLTAAASAMGFGSGFTLGRDLGVLEGQLEYINSDLEMLERDLEAAK